MLRLVFLLLLMRLSRFRLLHLACVHRAVRSMAFLLLLLLLLHLTTVRGGSLPLIFLFPLLLCQLLLCIASVCSAQLPHVVWLALLLMLLRLLLSLLFLLLLVLLLRYVSLVALL